MLFVHTSLLGWSDIKISFRAQKIDCSLYFTAAGPDAFCNRAETRLHDLAVSPFRQFHVIGVHMIFSCVQFVCKQKTTYNHESL